MVIILITNKQLLLLQQECNYLLIMWVVVCLFFLFVSMLFSESHSVFSVLIIFIVLNQYNNSLLQNGAIKRFSVSTFREQPPVSTSR